MTSTFMPCDPTRPFFAYGLFRPGQLAYFQLRDLASAAPAVVPGGLRVRDGVPFLDPRAAGSVRGALVTFDSHRAGEGYARIAALEPKHVYRWDTMPVSAVTANVLLGKAPDAGRPLEWPGWDSWQDPLFREALDLVAETANVAHGKRGYRALFERQMAYMLLWSAIERYLTFRYSLGGVPTQKIKKLGAEPAFATALASVVGKGRRVARSDDPSQPSRLDPDDPAKSVTYYYQVRCNVTHRGKTAPEQDGEILEAALDQLLPIFREVLKAAETDANVDYRQSH